MSSKRSSPEKKTSPRKKVKASPGQLILDQFFSSSNTVSSTSALSPGRTNNSDGESTTEKSRSEIIPDDTSSFKSSPRRLLDWELSVDSDVVGTSPDLEIIDETAPNSHLASRQSGKFSSSQRFLLILGKEIIRSPWRTRHLSEYLPVDVDKLEA